MVERGLEGQTQPGEVELHDDAGRWDEETAV